MTVGETIRAARERACLTQEMLGRLLGVQRHTVGHWELGQTYPGTRALARIQEVLGLEFPSRKPGRQPAERASYLKTQAATLTEGMDPEAEPEWGFRLRLCRLRLGLSQRELGARLGFSQAIISQYELGRVRPPRLKRIVLDEFMEENQ